MITFLTELITFTGFNMLFSNTLRYISEKISKLINWWNNYSATTLIVNNCLSLFLSSRNNKQSLWNTQCEYLMTSLIYGSNKLNIFRYCWSDISVYINELHWPVRNFIINKFHNLSFLFCHFLEKIATWENTNQYWQ